MCGMSCVNSLKVQGEGDCPETEALPWPQCGITYVISGQHRGTGASCSHLAVGAEKLNWKK